MAKPTLTPQRALSRFALSGLLIAYCQLVLALQPSFKLAIDTPERPVVNGETNLPDDTELIIAISRKESSYRAQDKVKVGGGKFRSAQFGQRSGNLNPGKYMVEVLMPFPAVQTDSVRAIIGERGEKLKGSLVRHESLGNLVKYVSSFVVESGPDARLDKAAREQDKKDTDKWVRDSCNWIFESSEKLRREGKLTGKELTPDERQKKFEKCVKEVGGKK
jgi:hypothetical protein